MYISIYFFVVMKILTDFRKTVETGMDPRLLVWEVSSHGRIAHSTLKQIVNKVGE